MISGLQIIFVKSEYSLAQDIVSPKSGWIISWIFNSVWLREYHRMDTIPCSSLSTDTVEYSNWTMVFRILSGSSQKVYATWNRTGQYDDYLLGRTGMQLGCVTLNASRACKTLFRSRLLDTWSTAAVKKVRIFTVHHFHNSKTWHLSNIHSAKPNKHKRQLLLPFHWKSRHHSVSDSSRANINTELYSFNEWLNSWSYFSEKECLSFT